MTPTSWINGRLVNDAAAVVSIRDTGLLHAAGAFTTMRAYGGNVFRLADHLARLRGTCEALSIPLPYDDEQIKTVVGQVIAANGLSDARLRLTATRGSGTNDPVHGLKLEPNTFLTATALEPYPGEYYEKGMTVMAYDLQKLNPYDMQAGHKTLNYLSRFAALRDANSRKAGEALWFNVHNYLQSGSISNVFIVKDGKLKTPPTQQELADPTVQAATPYPRSNVLPGIARKVVMELSAAAGVEIVCGALTIDDLLGADEVMLTNSIMEVMPVCRIERKAIGPDKPGDLTRKISALYRSAVDQFVAANN